MLRSVLRVLTGRENWTSEVPPPAVTTCKGSCSTSVIDLLTFRWAFTRNRVGHYRVGHSHVGHSHVTMMMTIEPYKNIYFRRFFFRRCSGYR